MSLVHCVTTKSIDTIGYVMECGECTGNFYHWVQYIDSQSSASLYRCNYLATGDLNSVDRKVLVSSVVKCNKSSYHLVKDQIKLKL